MSQKDVSKVNERVEELEVTVKNLDINLHERIDRVLLLLETHMKETGANFRQVDARFDQVDARFEEVDARFDQVDARFDQMKDYIDARFDQQLKMIVDEFWRYTRFSEEQSADHERRITALEKRLPKNS